MKDLLNPAPKGRCVRRFTLAAKFGGAKQAVTLERDARVVFLAPHGGDFTVFAECIVGQEEAPHCFALHLTGEVSMHGIYIATCVTPILGGVHLYRLASENKP